MQSTPRNLDLKKIQQEILKINGIKNVHHMHVWQIDENDIHLEAHLNLAKDIQISESCKLGCSIENILLKKFHINHVTLQFEYESCRNVSLIKQ